MHRIFIFTLEHNALNLSSREIFAKYLMRLQKKHDFNKLIELNSYLSGCLSMQSFKEEPTYTEVNPGENTELRCVVNDIGGECRWQKDGKVSDSMILYP